MTLTNNDTTIETIFGNFTDTHHDFHFLKFQGKPEGKRHHHWSVSSTETDTTVSITFGNQYLTIDKAEVPGLIFALEKVGLYRRPHTEQSSTNYPIDLAPTRGYARDSKGRFTKKLTVPIEVEQGLRLFCGPAGPYFPR